MFTGLILHTGYFDLGLDLPNCKLFVREGPCRVFTDMELVILGRDHIDLLDLFSSRPLRLSRMSRCLNRVHRVVGVR